MSVEIDSLDRHNLQFMSQASIAEISQCLLDLASDRPVGLIYFDGHSNLSLSSEIQRLGKLLDDDQLAKLKSASADSLNK
ncbi:MAG TPA: hypothetical protein VIK81_01070 [Patescibacteria group bacterium]